MKGTVIKTYVDKDTQRQLFEGDCVEYATDRAKFLAEKGFIKLDSIPKAEPEEAPKVETAVKKVAKPKAPAKTTAKKATVKKESR